MKALTVRQPWAEAIACGAKLVENRSMGTRYRGPLAIHAGKGWAKWGFADERLRGLWPDLGPFQRGHGYALRHVPAHHGRPPHPFVAGAVIAVAELVDVHEGAGCCEPWGERHYSASDGKRVSRVMHWVLEDVQRIEPPIPWHGRLGLWDTGCADVEELRRARAFIDSAVDERLAAAGKPEGHR